MILNYIIKMRSLYSRTDPIPPGFLPFIEQSVINLTKNRIVPLKAIHSMYSPFSDLYRKPMEVFNEI